MDKKKIGILVAIILGIILIIVSFTITPREEKEESLSEDATVILANAEKESKEASNKDQKEFIDISVDTYLEYYRGEESKIILIARPTCQYCQIAEPILHVLASEYDLNIYYLNTDNFSAEDKTSLLNSNEFFQTGFGTPLLLSVGQETIQDKIGGLTDQAHYIDFFKRNGYIES